MKLVFCASQRHYETFIEKLWSKDKDVSNYRYVGRPEMLRGYPRTIQTVKLGSFRDHPDYEELSELITQCFDAPVRRENTRSDVPTGIRYYERQYLHEGTARFSNDSEINSGTFTASEDGIYEIRSSTRTLRQPMRRGESHEMTQTTSVTRIGDVDWSPVVTLQEGQSIDPRYLTPGHIEALPAGLDSGISMRIRNEDTHSAYGGHYAGLLNGGSAVSLGEAYEDPYVTHNQGCFDEAAQAFSQRLERMNQERRQEAELQQAAQNSIGRHAVYGETCEGDDDD